MLAGLVEQVVRGETGNALAAVEVGMRDWTVLEIGVSSRLRLRDYVFGEWVIIEFLASPGCVGLRVGFISSLVRDGTICILL